MVGVCVHVLLKMWKRNRERSDFLRPLPGCYGTLPGKAGDKRPSAQKKSCFSSKKAIQAACIFSGRTNCSSSRLGSYPYRAPVCRHTGTGHFCLAEFAAQNRRRNNTRSVYRPELHRRPGAGLTNVSRETFKRNLKNETRCFT